MVKAMRAGVRGFGLEATWPGRRWIGTVSASQQRRPEACPACRRSGEVPPLTSRAPIDTQRAPWWACAHARGRSGGSCLSDAGSYPDSHASYIDHWRKLLRADDRAILTAAASEITGDIDDERAVSAFAA